MYAIIEDSGQQFKVAEGDEIQIDTRAAEPGSTIEFDRVVLVSDDGKTTIGRPSIEGAKVTAEVLRAEKGTKINVFKYKRRKKYRRSMGHRQQLLNVRITGIQAG